MPPAFPLSLGKDLKFTDLNIVIKEKTKEYEYSFPVKDLKRFDSLLPKFETVMDLYDAGEYEKLVESINEGEADSTKQQFVSYLKDQLAENGPVTRRSPLFGFGVYEKNERTRMVACYRVIQKKNNRWLELYMDLSGNQPKVIGLKHLD